MQNQQEQEDFSLMGNTQGFNIGNFDPAQIQEDEVILIVFAMDVSGSVQSYEPQLNAAFATFVEEMQTSHVADKIMVKIITFGETVKDRTGFLPIKAMDVAQFTFKAHDGATALYAGTKHALDATIAYRTQLESTGINVKSLVFTITDGEDNHSPRLNVHARDVASLIDNIVKEEKNIFSFQTILFGVGNNATPFENAQKDMHIKHLGVVGQSAEEIRRMIGMISASVSQSASNQAVTF